ncbi:hypothetical protein SDC9_199583 [bioreactor metagenome]|uniref:Uncharacterized protein n=1 Tax=bioreactor metagenome TaxID=1076179 RepID=A0A645IM64_9ZZZZ
MFMTVVPALFMSLFCIIINMIFLIYGLTSPYTFLMIKIVNTTMSSIIWSFGNFYLMLYTLGLLTTITEWKQIACSTERKILYTFTFPIFIFSYIPISIVALFKKVEWKPIVHNVAKTLEEVR